MPLVMSNGDVPDRIIFNGQEVEKVANTAGGFLWEKNTSPEIWVFNTDLRVNFTSNDGYLFLSIKVVVENGGIFKLKYDDVTAYDCSANTWTAAEYRVVSFTHAPLGKLRNWLQLNATLQ